MLLLQLPVLECVYAKPQTQNVPKPFSSGFVLFVYLYPDRQSPFFRI
jgi:hypothetical protein